MSARRIQIRDEEGKICTTKCWVVQDVGGYKVGFEVYAKKERFEAFSDANCEQIAWYDVRTELERRGYKIVEDIHEY
jgi:hypothetical protein